MRIGGVDPGRTGVAVVVDTVTGHAWQHKFKFGKDDNDLDMGRWFHFIQESQPSILFLERVAGHAGSGGATGKWSASTLFKLGDAFGQIRAAIAMSGKTHRLVSVSRWQKVIHTGIKGGTAKERSNIAYNAFYPSGPIKTRAGCKPNHNTMDAILIATFGVMEYQQRIMQWVMQN